MFPARWVMARLAPTGVEDPETRARVGAFAGWVSVGVNVALFCLKAVLAVLAGSLSLAADAMHTLSDVMTSLVLIIGFRLSRKPPDPRHPYGHGRMECIAALIIGVVLAVVSVEMLGRGISRLLNPQPLQVNALFLGLVGLSLAVKEWLTRLARALGNAIDSNALRADAAHHRSDVLSTVLVIVALVGARYGVLWLDGVMTIGVAGMIGWVAGTALVQAVNPLVGEQPSDAMLRRIEEIARSFPRVTGVHEIMVHRYGTRLAISLHVETLVDDALRLHEVSQAIEARLARHYPAHVIVHIDPINPNHPHYAAVREIVDALAAECDWVLVYHDLRLVGDTPFTVEFDVVPDGAVREAEMDALREKAQARLSARFADAAVLVRADAPYFMQPARADAETAEPGAGEGEGE